MGIWLQMAISNAPFVYGIYALKLNSYSIVHQVFDATFLPFLHYTEKSTRIRFSC